MNGRLIDAFVLAWVYDGRKHEAVAFDEGAYLHDPAAMNIEGVRLEINVNDKEIVNLGRLHTKQHRVQSAEHTASPQGVCNQSSKRIPHARRRRYRTSLARLGCAAAACRTSRCKHGDLNLRAETWTCDKHTNMFTRLLKYNKTIASSESQIGSVGVMQM